MGRNSFDVFQCWCKRESSKAEVFCHRTRQGDGLRTPCTWPVSRTATGWHYTLTTEREGSMRFTFLKVTVEIVVSGTCLCLLWLSVPVGEYYKSNDCRELLCEGKTVFCSICTLIVLIITPFCYSYDWHTCFLLLTIRCLKLSYSCREYYRFTPTRSSVPLKKYQRSNICLMQTKQIITFFQFLIFHFQK